LRRVLFVIGGCIAAQLWIGSAQAATIDRSAMDKMFTPDFPYSGEVTGPNGEGKTQPAPPPQAPPADAGPAQPATPAVTVRPGSIVAPAGAAPTAQSGSAPKAGVSGTGTPGSDGRGASQPEKKGIAQLLAAEEPAPAADAAPAPEETPAVSHAAAGARSVTSTAYCLKGQMASGRRTYWGAAAMNGQPIGTRIQVLSGPRAGETLVVEDRIGSGSSFDIAYPGDCQAAQQYGRRTISIQKI
jgi:hypothetical protein